MKELFCWEYLRFIEKKINLELVSKHFFNFRPIFSYTLRMAMFTECSSCFCL